MATGRAPPFPFPPPFHIPDADLRRLPVCVKLVDKVMSDSDLGPGSLSGNPPSVAGCPG